MGGDPACSPPFEELPVSPGPSVGGWCWLFKYSLHVTTPLENPVSSQNLPLISHTQLKTRLEKQGSSIGHHPPGIGPSAQ